jgi:citrate lyase subunit beta / citryl-CoA lyase
MIQTATSGMKGEQVRSDCFVSLTITEKDGITIELKSKVKALYGDSISTLCQEILSFFTIPNARLEIEDSGALPFTIAARVEAAIKKLIKSDKEFLLPFSESTESTTLKDRQRRSRLYLPGNNPKLMINAGIYGSDAIILDLEDSVAPDRKDEAQYLVRNALRAIDFNRAERMVRINQFPRSLEDLKFVVPHNVNLILIPKCENPEDVRKVDNAIAEILGHKNTEIYLMPIIESAKGVVKAYEIATASENVVALAIGLEDYTADIGVQRTAEGRESFYARSAIVNAAVAAGIQPIDSVFSDINDMEALARNVQESKSLGFLGMGCIHPRQVPVINENFSPSETEIEKAKKIVLAFEKAESDGIGVVSLGSKMIDAPVVKRVVKTIEEAVKSGKLSNDWRTGYEK